MTEVCSGREAIDKSLVHRPDLIFMDLVMPDMDGFEATQRFRQSSELKNIVIIASSASVSDPSRQSSRDAGCDDFLPKPIRAESLFDILRQYVSIEWVYEDSGKEDTNPESSQSLIVPPKEELITLYEAAKKGQIVAVRQYIANIEHLEAKYGPFAVELRHFAKGFNLKKLCEYLRPYVEENV